VRNTTESSREGVGCWGEVGDPIKDFHPGLAVLRYPMEPTRGAEERGGAGPKGPRASDVAPRFLGTDGGRRVAIERIPIPIPISMSPDVAKRGSRSTSPSASLYETIRSTILYRYHIPASLLPPPRFLVKVITFGITTVRNFLLNRSLLVSRGLVTDYPNRGV
jgi:hypothetical protein